MHRDIVHPRAVHRAAVHRAAVDRGTGNAVGPAASRVLGIVCVLSGLLLVGLAALALGLLGVWGFAAAAGAPGPGLVMLLGHCLGAVLAFGAHRAARDRTDWLRYPAALGAPAVLLVLGALFWWS